MPQDLTPGDGQDLFTRYKRAVEERDVDAMVALFAPDAEYRSDPFEQALAGSNAIRAYWNDIAATQVHVEFDAERVWVAGRTVLGSWHAAHTHRETASRVRVRGFSTIELSDDGLIVRMRSWPIGREVGADSSFEPESETGEHHHG